VKPYLTRFLKGDEQVLSVTGKPGSGKTVLSTVIDDYLQHPIGGTRYMLISASMSQFLLLSILPSCFPNQPCRWSDPRQHHPQRRRQDYHVANV
jgi:energy-coupling factor transporter ATP-binding protein EcfA2